MIRFTVAVSTILLGSLIAPPVAIGQEPSKAGPDAEKLLIQANELIGGDEEAVDGQSGASKDPDAPNASIYKLMDIGYNGYQVPIPIYRNRPLTKLFEALETSFGLSLSDADDTLRAQLEVPPGQGVVVVGVKLGSLAEHAGLKTNDVLLSLGDQAARDVTQVREILLGLGKEALQVRLIREGKPNRMSLVGPEHGFPPEAAEYWIGVPVSRVDATLRAHLTSLASEAGLIVNDVVKGSPAEKVGVLKNDILVSMDGKPLTTSDSLIEQIQATKGKPVPIEILRAGKPITVTMTPAKRAHPTVINLPGHPNSQVRYQVVQPNLAIEVDPKSTPTPGPDGKVEVKRWLSSEALRMDPFFQYHQYYAAPPASLASSKAPDVHLELLRNRATTEAPNARIEAQFKEIMAKLDGITKALDAIKKPAKE